jgi:integrase
VSIRKRSWKTRAGAEKQAWVLDYVDQLGCRHSRHFDKKKQAESHQARIKIEITHGTHAPDAQSITVAEAASRWLATCEGHGLERATTAAYRQHVALHIVPYLGRLKLSQLSAPLIRDFEDKLRAGAPAPGEAEGRARSPAMLRKIRSSLGSLIGDAQERGLVARNVVRELRSGRRRGGERRADRRQRGKLKIGLDIPTPREISSFLAALQGRWRPLLLTAVFSGLRASELRGLQWSDVDLQRNELHVRQRADRYNKIGKPKSEAGERTVPLIPLVANALRELKLASKTKDLVFPNTKGTIDTLANIVAFGLKPAMIRAGVTVPVIGKDGRLVLRAKYTGLHSLRHFFASFCINRKEDGGLDLPPKVVQERLGHSTIAMTLDVYGHLFPRSDDHDEQMEEAAQRLLGLHAT